MNSKDLLAYRNMMVRAAIEELSKTPLPTVLRDYDLAFAQTMEREFERICVVVQQGNVRIRYWPEV